MVFRKPSEEDRCGGARATGASRLSAAGQWGPSQAAALRLCFLEWKQGCEGHMTRRESVFPILEQRKVVVITTVLLCGPRVQ